MQAFSKHTQQISASQGFTLVELMIAMFMGGIVMMAVMASFRSQHQTYLAQDEVVAMQQNIRVAMDMMTRDIRIAGYSPTGSLAAFNFVDNVQFSNAAGTILTTVNTNSANIAFRVDLNGNGTVDLAATDTDGDGTIDMSEMEQVAFRLSGTTLQRYSTTTGAISWQAVAENFEAIEFYYLMADGSRTLNPGTLTNIRGVQISLLARTAIADSQYTATPPYTTASGAVWGPFNDGLRRQLLIQTVICRNLGL